ncbi:MAG TPA: medium chain dehydrogenase/reductase family protein, partial [Armatimonadota bacterium]
SGGPDEVVVKTLYSLVSTGTELRVWGGHYGAADKFPLIPGYSIVGEVTEIGTNITDVQVGDLVSGRNPLPVPGINAYWGAQASHHRYLTVGYDGVVKLPQGVEPLDCLIAEIGAISWRGVKHAGMQAGESALVTGQGLIGTLAMRFLLMHGVKTVVTDIHPFRLERARTFGAGAVNARDADAEAQIKALLPDGADIIVEASGLPQTALQAFRFLRGRKTGEARPLPRVIFQANYLEQISANLAGFVPSQSVALFYPADREMEDRQDVLNFVAQGKLHASEFIGETHDFRDAPRAYPLLRDEPDKHFSVAFRWA